MRQVERPTEKGLEMLARIMVVMCRVCCIDDERMLDCCTPFMSRQIRDSGVAGNHTLPNTDISSGRTAPLLPALNISLGRALAFCCIFYQIEGSSRSGIHLMIRNVNLPPCLVYPRTSPVPRSSCFSSSLAMCSAVWKFQRRRAILPQIVIRCHSCSEYTRSYHHGPYHCGAHYSGAYNPGAYFPRW